MTSALDLIQDSLEMLGIYAAGETITSADADRGLNTLNDMIDSWSNEPLACFAILEQSAPLIPGQQSYTIGSGGNFNMTRPLKILDGPGTAYVQDSNGNNYAMDVVPRDKWNMYGNRSSIITSNFPDTLFYDPQFPLGIINVMPVPTINYTMFWDSYAQLSDLSDLAATLSLPPGYKRAITTNLALCLKPYFKKSDIDPLIVAEALQRLGTIKRTNARSNVAIFDSEIVSRAQVGYNPYTDRSGNTSG